MEEYIRQEEEEKRRYQAYIDRRRKEILTKQTELVNRLNNELKQKYQVKRRLESSDFNAKNYPKNFLNDIISRCPKEQPEQELKDIGQILNHLSEKRNQLV